MIVCVTIFLKKLVRLIHIFFENDQDIDGDHETQVRAVETCIASGAKGILIAASDTKAIVPVLKNAQDNGLLVIALDTPLEPITAADSTFATDNFKAGELGGAWVA